MSRYSTAAVCASGWLTSEDKLLGPGWVGVVFGAGLLGCVATNVWQEITGGEERIGGDWIVRNLHV